MRPITPREAIEKTSFIPPEVIVIFNQLILENMCDKSATIKQKDVVERAAERMGISQSNFDYRWMNVEELYRRQGWRVEYDKPAYNESYAAFFVFTAP